MGTLVNAIKAIFASKKTTDSNYAVALLNKSDASPAGYMELPDLAAVAAGVLDLSNRDLNSVLDNQVYFVNSTWANRPIDNDGFLVVYGLKSKASVTQIYWCANPANGVYIRNTLNKGNTWRGWYKIQTALV